MVEEEEVCVRFTFIYVYVHDIFISLTGNWCMVSFCLLYI